VYQPSDILDVSASKASLMATPAYVSGLSANDDREYSSDRFVYAGAWPGLWKLQRFDYFNYSFT
jgi:hypothetical protein